MIFATKQDAINAFGGKAGRCDRCKGWHADVDRPKSRAGRKARQVDNRPKDLQ